MSSMKYKNLQVNPLSPTCKSVQPPSPTSKSVKPPSHTSQSNHHVKPQSQTSKSNLQVKPPSQTSKSNLQVSQTSKLVFLVLIKIAKRLNIFFKIVFALSCITIQDNHNFWCWLFIKWYCHSTCQYSSMHLFTHFWNISPFFGFKIKSDNFDYAVLIIISSNKCEYDGSWI